MTAVGGMYLVVNLPCQIDLESPRRYTSEYVYKGVHRSLTEERKLILNVGSIKI